MGLNLASLPQFHSTWLEKIKKSVGASNVCYITNREGYFIRVIKDGKEQRFSLTGTPLDVTNDRYKEFNKLVLEHYEQI